MLWTRGTRYLVIAALLLLAFSAGAVRAQDDSESRKIGFLIASVENLTGAKFDRNVSEYEGKEAAGHLRMKLRRAAAKVQTADDFIKICASKSYISGKPYLIKFSDGKTMTTEEFLRETLKGYQATPK
jgi:hypothetical protein